MIFNDITELISYAALNDISNILKNITSLK